MGENWRFGEKPVSVPICPLYMSYGLSWSQNQAPALKYQWLSNHPSINTALCWIRVYNAVNITFTTVSTLSVITGDKPGMLDYMIWPWCERSEMLKIMGGDQFVLSRDRFLRLVSKPTYIVYNVNYLPLFKKVTYYYCLSCDIKQVITGQTCSMNGESEMHMILWTSRVRCDPGSWTACRII